MELRKNNSKYDFLSPGVLSAMDTIAFNNDLGHPICQNLREGNWMIDYIINRLKIKPTTKAFGERLEEIYQPLREIPRYSVPCYFYNITSCVYKEILELAPSLMAEYVFLYKIQAQCNSKSSWIIIPSFSSVQKGSEFYKLLALGSLQFGGYVESSPLPPLSKNIDPPQPELAADNKTPLCVSLSAGIRLIIPLDILSSVGLYIYLPKNKLPGLPHFATGYTRNWGRDTFISLRGMFLLTGRYDEAR